MSQVSLHALRAFDNYFHLPKDVFSTVLIKMVITPLCILYILAFDREDINIFRHCLFVNNKHFYELFVLRVLERLGARALSAHVRVFADYLVYEFSTSVGGKHVSKV